MRREPLKNTNQKQGENMRQILVCGGCHTKTGVEEGFLLDGTFRHLSEIKYCPECGAEMTDELKILGEIYSLRNFIEALEADDVPGLLDNPVREVQFEDIISFKDMYTVREEDDALYARLAVYQYRLAKNV